MNPTSIQSSAPSAGKDLSLEAVRGVASLSVLGWHFLFAFYPAFLFDPREGFLGSPFYGLLHGTAAVGVFFLLSGFVLTRRYFETGHHYLLLEGALKRWFRLMPLVTISVLLSWGFFHFKLYDYTAAAAVTGTDWLAQSGGSKNPPVHEGLGAALEQGLFGTFFKGESSFNTNLWTIRFEMIGSLMAFAFAGLVQLLRGKQVWLALGIGACAVTAYAIDPRYEAFLVGTLLAAFLPAYRGIGRLGAAGLLLLGLFLLGYRAPLGAYAFMMPLQGVDRETMYVFSSILGGALILVACTGCATLNRALQNSLARLLGQISFPLYLLHVILICSLGAALFVRLASGSRDDYFHSVFNTALVLMAVLFFLSLALAGVDRWWIGHVNRVFARVFRRFSQKAQSPL